MNQENMQQIAELPCADRVAASVPARLLTEREAAELLALSRRTLEAWRARGGGPRFVKLGKLVRYRPGDLEKFVRRNLHQGRRTA